MRVNEFQKHAVADLRNLPPVSLDAAELDALSSEAKEHLLVAARVAFMAGLDLDSVMVELVREIGAARNGAGPNGHSHASAPGGDVRGANPTEPTPGTDRPTTARIAT